MSPGTSPAPDIVSALLRPAAYPHPITNPGGTIQQLQTHISWVFLTGDYAYKVKKPVDFGFLDFTTLDQREHFCQEELRLNSRLSPELYLEVLPLVERAGGQGAGTGPLAVGSPEQAEQAVDWCLKMKQMDQAHLMPAQLAAGNIVPDTMVRLARDLARFHALAPTGRTNAQGQTINEHGTLATVRSNCQENFDQTRQLQGGLIPPALFEAFELATHAFLDHNAQLVASRIDQGRIRECHGDLHAGNIFVLPDGRPLIFDAIEFNRRFSCSDVAAEVAFLAMDLEHRDHPELARAFISAYVAASNDQQLLQMLPFYMAYRAHVRAKVISFRLNDELTAKERAGLEAELTSYFELAHRYLTRPLDPGGLNLSDPYHTPARPSPSPSPEAGP